MPRSLVVPLLVLAACASQTSPVAVGAARTTTVTIETDNASREIRMTPTRPQMHSGVVPVPVEQAWAALPAAYAAMGLANGRVLDEGERRFAAGPMTAPRRLDGGRLSAYLDCGATVSMPNADAYAVTLQIATRLVPEGAAATRVQTILEATARPRDTAGNTVTCTSTGQLERRIAEQLKSAR